MFNRFEKLRFILQEMELALHLARRAPDDFTSRVLCRHILIRAENFIEHARRLRKPLNSAGFKTSQYHDQKEIYAKFFEEYFQVARDKMGGHVQDYDFGKRIELWNDIEIVKIEFFVQTAIDIYAKILGGMGIPGFVAYSSSPDISSAELGAILEELAASRRNSRWVEIGSDPLAMTRPNTGTVLNMTPVHSRAGQICLIRRWITAQKEILDRTTKFPDVERLLKSRILTDVVSLCDCLITRSTSPGAPQELEGLDKILLGLGADASPITDFLASFRFEARLSPIRTIRDKIGAHLEVDPASALKDLLTMIDAMAFAEVSTFFDRIAEVFLKTCRTVLYLRPYVVDSQPLYGISVSSEPSTIAPFDTKSPKTTPIVLSQPIWNDEAVYQSHFDAGLRGDEHSRGEARHYFWEAFQHSESVEKIEELEILGTSGHRRTQHDFRRAHKFFSDQLSAETDPKVVEELFELLISCGNGWRYPLSEIVVRHGEKNRNLPGDASICLTLGLVSDWPHNRVKLFLDSAAKDTNWFIRFQAILALYRIFIRTEGIRRINKRKIEETYDSAIVAHLSGLNEKRKLHLTLAFASQFCGGSASHYFKEFEDDYKKLQMNIKDCSLTVVGQPAFSQIEATFDKLLATHDYAGVVMMLYDQLNDGKDSEFAKLLLASVVNRWIVSCNHDQSTRHFSGCLLRAERFEDALLVANSLAANNPDDQHYQLFRIQILFGSPDRKGDAKTALDLFKKDYVLDSRWKDMADELESLLKDEK